MSKDTAVVKIYVKDALNYPVMLQEYQRTVKTCHTYILQLKYAFVQLDKKVKNTKNTRTTFDLTTASTALGGTVFSSASIRSAKYRQNSSECRRGACSGKRNRAPRKLRNKIQLP